MTRQILLKNARGARAALLLDVDTGRVTPSGLPPETRGQGSVAVIEDQTFALYRDGGVLWLQWNEARWPIGSDDVQLNYVHDLDAATTTFSVNERSFTYPAWWRGDPAFDPLLPEEDEHHDFLAFVMVVKQDPAMQASLHRDA
jgi:hypothetical protein